MDWYWRIALALSLGLIAIVGGLALASLVLIKLTGAVAKAIQAITGGP